MRLATLLLFALLAAVMHACADEPKKGEAAPIEPTEEEKSALEEMLQTAEEAEEAPPAPARGPRRGAEKKDDRRGEISDEASAGGAQTTAANPRQNLFSDVLRGSIYVSSTVTLWTGVSVTHESDAPPPPGTPFSASYGGNSALLSLGFDWDPSNHVTLGAHVDGSPKSQQYSATTLTYVPANAPARCRVPRPPRDCYTATDDGLVRTTSSMFAFGASGGYDTAGESNFESALTFGATLADLLSDERLSQVEGRGGRVINADQHRTLCANNPAVCTASLRRLLNASGNASVWQLRTTAAFSETFFEDTD